VTPVSAETVQLERDVFALCMVVPRAAAVQRLAALLPARADEEGEGLHLIWLPFADDRRHLAFAQDAKRSLP
jgi:hypothetical protein